MPTINDLLHQKGGALVAVDPDWSVLQAVIQLAENNIGAIIVIDLHGKLIGILSERDITKAVADIGPDLMYQNVRTLMTENVITCGPSETVVEALTRMNQHHIRHLPVVDGPKVLGIVSIRDLMSSVLALLGEENVRLRGQASAA